MQTTSQFSLRQHSALILRQRLELFEFAGFETRNKYEIRSASGAEVGFAAEQQKGWGGFLMRQFLGHWRSFTLHFFTPDRTLALVADHPFRWFFPRLEISTGTGKKLGAIQTKFGLLSKLISVEDRSGREIFIAQSPFWKPWTFDFSTGEKVRATVRKKWSGLGAELFTDKDTFSVEFTDPSLTEEHCSLILAAALHIDLRYFEKKARQ